MTKKNNTIIWIIGIVVLLIMWQSGFLINIFSMFQPASKDLVQYTARPVCSGVWCTWFHEGEQIASDIVQINTGKNIFRFESDVASIQQKKQCHTLVEKKCSASRLWSCPSTFIDSDGCQHWDCKYGWVINWGYYRDPCGSPGTGTDCFVSGNAQIGCTTGCRYGGNYCGVCGG